MIRYDTAIGDCQHFEEYEAAKTSSNIVNKFTVISVNVSSRGNAETKDHPRLVWFSS